MKSAARKSWRCVRTLFFKCSEEEQQEALQ